MVPANDYHDRCNTCSPQSFTPLEAMHVAFTLYHCL
jgi:hypothetical protein